MVMKSFDTDNVTTGVAHGETLWIFFQFMHLRQGDKMNASKFSSTFQSLVFMNWQLNREYEQKGKKNENELKTLQ